MTKIVTGFETIEDVKKILKLYEEKGWKWSGGESPLDYNDWENNFNKAQTDGGFYIGYNNDFTCGSANISGKGKEQINFKDLLNEFVEGEEVYVSNISVEDALKWEEKRIYLCKIPGNATYQHICIEKNHAQRYKDGGNFSWCSWKYIAKIPKETLIEIQTTDGQRISITKEKAIELGFIIKE